MLLYAAPAVPTSVPVIDIGDTSDAGRRRAADDIHKACREIGFFTITNHGVPAKLIAAQFAAAKAFFDLPLDQRMAIHMKNSPATAGYEPIGGQVLDSQDDSTEQAPPDLKESFYCGLELAADHPLSLRPSRCFGHNQWPALPGFREQNLAYYDALSELSARLMHLLALSLDLPENWFDRFHNPAAANLRMIKYPPHPANAAFNQIGAGAHTDWGGVTILAQDDVGGLEVQTADGAWVEARPIADTFVINLGDLMARWTNGIYASNLHRVKNNSSGRDRYSIPYFYGPFPTSVIEAIPTCVDAAHPRLYAACTADDHMLEMFRRSYGYAPETV